MWVRVAVGAVVLLVGGCAALAYYGSAPYRRTVGELTALAETEDGWHVLEVPNLHEGGGVTTWWFPPCDPAREVEHEVTRTGYSYPDTLMLPFGRGEYVDTRTVPCAEPSRELALDRGRRVRLGVSALPLGGDVYGLTAEQEPLIVEDLDLGSRTAVDRLDATAHGPCDGRAVWTVRRFSPVEVHLRLANCADWLTALPSEALALLDLDGYELTGLQEARLPAEQFHAFDAAMAEAGWGSNSELQDPPNPWNHAFWYGPCAPALDADDETRTEVLWHDGRLRVDEGGCE